MIKYSCVHERIEAQPHPFDPGSRHPGNHSDLLRRAHHAATRTQPQRADGDAQPFRDIHSHRYLHIHPDRDAQYDFDRDGYQYHADTSQCDPTPDIYANIYTNIYSHIYPYTNTNRHFHANFYANFYANLHTNAHIDTHTFIYLYLITIPFGYTNPFGYTLPIRYGFSCSNLLI